MKSLIALIAFNIFRLLNRIKSKAFRNVLLNKFRAVGENFIFDPLSSTLTPEMTTIGNNVFLAENANFSGGVCIGNNVMFGPGATIMTGNHIYAIMGKSPRFLSSSTLENLDPVLVEDEVWIGANVTILGGVTIGVGSVVGAGSVVVNDICPYTVSVGNPCKPVRCIFNDDTLEKHLKAIGNSAEYACEIVERRRKFLDGIKLKAVDKTNDYKNVVYEKN